MGEEVKSCAFPVGAPVVCYYSTRSKCAIGHFEMLERDDPAGRFKTLWLKAHTPGKIGVMDPKAVEAATTGGDLVNKQGSGKNGQQGRLFGNNGQQGRLFGKNGQQGRLFGKNGQQGRGMNKNGMNKQGQHKNGMNKNKWGSNKNKKKNKNKWGSNKNKKKNKNGMPSSLGQIANSLSLGRQMKQ